MKTAIFILAGSLAVAGAYQFSTRGAEEKSEKPPSTVVEKVALLTPRPEVQKPEDYLPGPKPDTEEPPAMVKNPVRSVEERGDNMLSEIDMLGGMPFDQSITMPFE